MLAHNHVASAYNPHLVQHVLRSKCESDLLFYIRYMFKNNNGMKFIVNHHHEVICNKLQDVFDGKTKRLIINIPCRFGKTEAANNFISWALGKAPHSNFLLVSYGADLATANSYSIRNTVSSDAFQAVFPECTIKADSRAKNVWETSGNGKIRAAGLNGALRGQGAGTIMKGQGFGGAIIIDDPQENSRIFNGKKRDDANKAYQDTIKGRLNSEDTPIIVIMQRLHVKDFTDFLINESGDEWEVLTFPALNEDGTALWEYRFSAENLIKMKENNPATFAAQMQQKPYSADGSLFKETYWSFYNEEQDYIYKFIVADTASKTGQHNDFTVFQLWGVKGSGNDRQMYLIDQLRGKFEVPEVHDLAYNFYKKHDCYNLRHMVIEDKSSGIGLIQDLSRKAIPIRGIQPKGDKLERASNVIKYVETKRVHLPQNAKWITDYLVEHAQFTGDGSGHDDQVDCTVYAIIDTFANAIDDYSWVE